MDSLQTVLIAIATFGVLVTFHEFGHFWVARRCGVKVIRFAVGFGPRLFGWRDKQGTDYAVCALPLGGYVRMVDEREGEVSERDKPFAFNNQSVGARVAIVAAGPLANFLLALLAFWLIFVSGVSGLAPVLGPIKADSPAALAGLRYGDEIISLDGEATPTWRQVNQQLLRHLGESGSIAMQLKDSEGQLFDASIAVDNWLIDAVEPDLVRDLGLNYYEVPGAPVMDEIIADSAAAEAGLQQGDTILSADEVALLTAGDWSRYVRSRAGQAIAIQVQRGDNILALQITPREHRLDDGSTIGRVGTVVQLPPIPAEMIRQFHYSPLAAAVEAGRETWKLSVFTLESIYKLVQGLISPKNLSGPITIAKVASDSARMGMESYLGVLALLSISLGVLNLLPIPVLDGGHLLYYLVEAVKGSPLSEQAQQLGFRVGISLVACLMLLAIYNDVSRL